MLKFLVLRVFLIFATIAGLLWSENLFWSSGKQHAKQTRALNKWRRNNFTVKGESYGPYRGVVDRVQDGDTIYCKLDLGFDITIYARVRVLGINAPEISTPAGQEATAFARVVLPVGSKVSVTSYGWDKYGGRVDGKIVINEPVVIRGHGERDFAQIMLLSNHAVPYSGR
jgi:endonuclease YncB( thermonuclease family)